jgi:hypothetical protein
MNILTKAQAIAFKGAVDSLSAIGSPDFSINIVNSGERVLIIFEMGVITIGNAIRDYERYKSIEEFAFSYEIV